MDCFEIWYVTFGRLVLQSLYKWWPWDDIDLFGPLGFGMGKTGKVHLFGAVVLSDMKVQSDSTPMEFKRWRSFCDPGQSSLVRHMSTFSKDFSSKTSLIFHMQPSGKGGKKVYIFGPIHVTKMATMPSMVKALKICYSSTTRWIALKLKLDK